jgi:hypothetical protein
MRNTDTPREKKPLSMPFSGIKRRFKRTFNERCRPFNSHPKWIGATMRINRRRGQNESDSDRSAFLNRHLHEEIETGK